MVTISIVCPQCGKDEAVRRYGTNRSGTARCYCNTCRCAFTLNPKPRHLDEEKAALIRHALQEKTPVSAICRMFKVSPKTVYALMRGSRVALFLMFGVEENFWKHDWVASNPQEKVTARLEPPREAIKRPTLSASLVGKIPHRLLSSFSLLACLALL